MSQERVRGSNPLFASPNRLKLGSFCSNTAPYMTRAPERWRPTWQNCVRAGRLVDDAGWEAIVPIARWKGYVDGKPDHPTNEILEVFTFAAAMAQATRYAAVFATSHAPTAHPVFVAKQCATIDAISGGRFALNVVGGWNRREFDMFGIDLLPHDQRYEYLAEWLALLRRLWSGEEFDEESNFFHMRGAVIRPQPMQGRGIPIMNAALSPIGIRFSAQNSDIGLITPNGPPSEWAEQISHYKTMAREEFGREIQIWTNATMWPGRNQAEAEDLLRRVTDEMLDVEAVDNFMHSLSVENGIPVGSDRYNFMRKRISVGTGYPIVGGPERIAEELQTISEAGIDGIIMSWVDFLGGIAAFNVHVLPLLEQVGLREPFVGEINSPEILEEGVAR